MTDRGVTSARARSAFGPVILLGLAGGAVGAVAGNKAWAEATGRSATQVSSLALTADAAEMPVAAALSLVVLACWGVVLVSRGRVRRAVTVLGALAALGTFASVVVGFSSVPAALRSSFEDAGIAGVGTDLTGWFWLSAVGAVLSVLATLLAVRWVPGWPEMGSRYDAPGSEAPEASADPADQSSLDLWKAMDEGRDPTS